MAFQASSMQMILRVPLQLAHLGDEHVHDHDGDHRKEDGVVLDVVQLKDDEALLQQVQPRCPMR